MDFGDSRTASQPPRIDREALIADITELGLDINIGLVHSSAVTRDLSIYEEYLENSSDSEHDEHGDSEHEFVTASRTSGENSNESGNESEDSVPYIILSDEHDDFTEFTSAESNRYDEWKPPEESKTSFSDSITQDEDVSIGNSEPNISSNKVTVVPNIPPLSQGFLMSFIIHSLL
jgi:hypothetical protein